MLYLFAGDANTRGNLQNHHSIPARQRQPPALTVETGSASGLAIPFSPPILDLVLGEYSSYFMDANLPDSGDCDISQSFCADAAVVSEEDLFINNVSIDTKVSSNPRRRKRTSPVTPISHAHAHVFSNQFSQSFAASQGTSGHSRVPLSSNPQPSVYHAFGQLPVDVGQLNLSPSLMRSHRPQRSRSASQILQPPSSQAGSSRNPSPRLSTSSASARTNNNQPTETTDPPPKKKRRRQALSCTECKRRKIRCDRVQPCVPCKKRGEGDKCRWHILEPVCVYPFSLFFIQKFSSFMTHLCLHSLRPREIHARSDSPVCIETNSSPAKSTTKSKTLCRAYNHYCQSPRRIPLTPKLDLALKAQPINRYLYQHVLPP